MPSQIIPVSGKPLVKGRIGVRPTGRSASSALSGDVKDEHAKIGELAEQMETDYQVLLAKRTLDAKVASVPITFSVENGDASAEVLKTHIEKLWESTLASMNEAFSHGRVAYEKIWDWLQDGAVGVTIIRKLDPLPFEKTEMELNENSGDFEGIEVKPKKGSEFTLPPDKSWWLALDPTALEPHGRSRYLGAPFKVWKTRKKSHKLRDTFLTRFALGQGIFRGPATKEDEDGNNFDNHAAAAGAYDASRAGGLFTMSNARDPDQPAEYDENFEQLPEVKDGSSIDATIDNQDAEQIRAFGFSEKTVTEGSAVGSFAMVAEQVDLLDAVALGILAQYADSFQKFVIDKMVETNYGANSATKITLNYPRLRDTTDSAVIATVNSWLSSPQLSPLILSGAVDVGQMLTAAGVPVSDDVDAKIAQMIEEQKAAAAVPAGGPAIPFRQQVSRAVSFAVDTEADVPTLVPTQEKLVGDAMRELDRLFAAVEKELAAQHGGKSDDGTLALLLEEIVLLDADAMTASTIIGMTAPFEPELAPTPAGHKTQKQLEFAIQGVDNLTGGLPEGQRWRFPWIDGAIGFLESKEIATADEVRLMASAEKTKVFTAARVNSTGLLESLRQSVADSLAKGESLREFRERIQGQAALTRAETETLYRTNTHQGYIAGQEIALDKPHVAVEFPFVQYAATDDTRVRVHHWAMDGKVVARGTREHQVMLANLKEWNCRCDLIPMSREDAEAIGVTTFAGLPSSVKTAQR